MSLFRIQAVSDATGVSTATLRAWERRYGFPVPRRSASAYRLYSDEDIALVKRMQELIETGVMPSEAARQLLETTSATEPDLAGDPYDNVVERIVEATIALDAKGLQEELHRVVLAHSGTAAFQRVLRPALIRIGDLWHAGELSVAAEHFASHLISGTVLDLLRMVPIADGAPTILMACFAEELHALPLYGAALDCATHGMRPILLGARTPPSAVSRAVHSTSPDLVGLSVTVGLPSLGVARELVDGYADACGDIPWLVGGAGAAALEPLVTARGGQMVGPDSSAMHLALLEALRKSRRRPRVASKPASRRRKN